MLSNDQDPYSTASTVGLTIRDLVLEVRTSVQALRNEVQELKSQVVLKSELDLYKEQQRVTRRWSIGIIISVIAASSTGVSVVVGLMS